jgi:hypothetical protein
MGASPSQHSEIGPVSCASQEPFPCHILVPLAVIRAVPVLKYHEHLCVSWSPVRTVCRLRHRYSFDKSINRRVIYHSTSMPSFQIISLPIYCQTLSPPLVTVLRSVTMQTCGGKIKKRQSYPCNRPWRPIGFWGVEASTSSRQSAHRWQ